MGHGTDVAIQKMINRPEDTEIIWESAKSLPHHPNGMLFEALKNGEVVDRWEVYSVGGGALWDEQGTFKSDEVYPIRK